MGGEQNNNAAKLPQFLAAMGACMGAFCLGNGFGWTSPTYPSIICDKEEDTGCDYYFDGDQSGWISGFFALGAFFSSFVTGVSLSTVGRRWSLIGMGVPFVLGWVLLLLPVPLGLSADAAIWMFYLGRFITGFAGGSYALSAPVYIGETSEASLRGALGSCMQLVLCFGVLFCYAVGAAVDWVVLTGICVIFPFLTMVGMFFMPPSPVFLLSQDREEEARKALQWLRGSTYNIEREIKEIKDGLADQKETGTVSLKAMFTEAVYRKPTIIMLMLMVIQQLGGINAIIMYLTSIFIAAGTDLDEGLQASLVSMVQVIATLIAVLIVDKLGRRILLISSALIQSLSIICLGIYFWEKEHSCSCTDICADLGADTECVTDETLNAIGFLPLASLMIFIAGFSIGFGPVPWMMNGELFSAEAKSVGASLATATNWICAFIISKFYPNLEELLRTSGAYWLFGAVCAAGAVYVMLFVPETKGKNPQEIKRYFAGDKSALNGAKTNKAFEGDGE